MRNFKFWFVILSILLLASCGKKETTSILLEQGNLIFEIQSSEVAVGQAEVHLENHGSRLSDLKGLVIFTDVYEGEYETTVIKGGFQVYTKTYTFNGEDQVVQVELSRSPVQPPEQLEILIEAEQLTLQWEHSGREFIASYLVYRSIDGTNFQKISEVDASQNQLVDTDVENGAIYYYQIYTKNIFNETSKGSKMVYAIPSPILTYHLLYSKVDHNNGSSDIYIYQDGTEGNLTQSLAMEIPGDYHLPTDQLVYVSDESGVNQIYAMTLTDGSIRQLTSLAKGADTPNFSTDGQQIAFLNLEDEYIYVMSATGNNLVQLAKGQEPVWAGDQVLFIAPDTNGVDNLFQIQVDGTGLQQITFFEIPVKSPAISVDGEKMAYIRGKQLCLANLDGSNEIFLTQPISGDIDSPAWAPLGDEILYVQKEGEDQMPMIYSVRVYENSKSLIGTGLFPLLY